MRTKALSLLLAAAFVALASCASNRQTGSSSQSSQAPPAPPPPPPSAPKPAPPPMTAGQGAPPPQFPASKSSGGRGETAAPSKPIPSALPPGIKGYRDVYFATDRQATGTGIFANAESRPAALRYGLITISIPQSHQRGQLERPWKIWTFELPESPSRHLVISSRRVLDIDSFFANINQDIDSAPERSAFVLVHGFNVTFDDAALRTGQLAFDLQFRGPAILYSWPSAGTTSGYVHDLDMTDWTAPHLETFLRDLRARTGVRTVHLVAHSMGSRAVGMALDRIARGAGSPVRFQELILAAPDVNSQVLEQLSSSLKSGSDRVTMYASDKDRALGASMVLRQRGYRAGGDPGKLPPLPGFDIVDASRAKSSLLNHSYFAEDSRLLKDIADLIKQRSGPGDRAATLERIGEIWRLRR